MGDRFLTKESFTNYRYFETDDTYHTENSIEGKQRPDFATYLTLYESDFYQVNDLNCYYGSRHVFKPNFTCRFSMNFTRTGYFTFQTYKRLEEEYSSRIMLEKPSCEFRFVQPEPGFGGCTVFSFANEAFEMIQEHYPLKENDFFKNPDIFSTVIASNAEADFLHYRILHCLSQDGVSRLEIDCLLDQLLEEVLHKLLGLQKLKEASLSTKRFHLRTIERAKEYLLENFCSDITLRQLANHCYISHFHFTRLFKQFCGYSPFGYLQKIRLKHAENLITTTDLPVADICFRSGFKRLDYFSSAFTKQYGASPTKYKSKAATRFVFFRELQYFERQGQLSQNI